MSLVGCVRAPGSSWGLLVVVAAVEMGPAVNLTCLHSMLYLFY